MKEKSVFLLRCALAMSSSAIAFNAVADDMNCASSLVGFTVDGNVIVNGACRLNAMTVKGNVLVYSGGDLTLVGGRVEGNVQSDGAASVQVENANIDGDVQLDGLSNGPSRVYNSRVGGNVQLEGNRTSLVIESSIIDGDLQAFSNSGGVVVRNNSIAGNLQCKTNNPSPSGGFNQVAGNKEDQCASLSEVADNGPTTVCPAAQFDSATGMVRIPCVVVDGNLALQYDVELAPPYQILRLTPN